jgi:nucleoside-diphosphate-sugar epimerase
MSLLLKKRKKEGKRKTQKKREKDIQRELPTENVSIVVGANSPLGIHVVNELLERGKKVRILVSNEKKARKFFFDKEIEIFQVNLRNIIAVINSIDKKAIVYHCVKTPVHRWFKDHPIIHYNIVHAVKKHEAKLVYVDNLSVYGKMKGTKITEKDPLIPDSEEGLLRKQLAEQVIIGDQRKEFKAVIVRFPDFYGPYVVNDFSKKVFEKPLKNQPAKWYIDTNQPHSFIYIKDAAKALVNIGEYPEAYGQIWHISGPEAITGSQLLRMIFVELNKEPVIKIQTKFWIKVLSFFDSGLGRIKDRILEWEYPFVIDGSKYYETFEDEKPTTHRKAISETLEWFKERLEKKQRDKKYYAFRYYHPIR